MIDTTSSVYRLAEKIAAAELAKATLENRVRNPDAFSRKVRDNMLERTQQRGTTWLVEQAGRFGIETPEDLKHHVPTRMERDMKKPALCTTCGVCLPYDPARNVRVVEGWPWAVSPCGRGYAVPNCRVFQERGTDEVLQQMLVQSV